MAIVVPSAESVKSLSFPLIEKQCIVAQTLLEVLQEHPHSRILLWASIFILQAVGIPQRVVAAWFGCSTRNLRCINQKVRTIRRGDGKTGRPPKPKESTGGTTGHRLQRLCRPLASFALASGKR